MSDFLIGVGISAAAIFAMMKVNDAAQAKLINKCVASGSTPGTDSCPIVLPIPNYIGFIASAGLAGLVTQSSSGLWGGVLPAATIALVSYAWSGHL